MGTVPEPLADASAELVQWPPIGRLARGGGWDRQAQTTPARIEAALDSGRREEAAALTRHLVSEAEEIHDLLGEWCERIPAILAREGVEPEELRAIEATLARRAGEVDPVAEWGRFRECAEAAAVAIEAGDGGIGAVQEAVAAWLDGHDPHLVLAAGWVDAAVRRLGEERLGELWAELQAGPIDSYGRYDVAVSPWSQSFSLLVQIALEGMHAHYGGPRRQGEIELIEHADRIEMRFDPCGSGGRLRRAEQFGVTAERHPFAWNRTGVCHYCVHCCVLQQLEPIRRLGYPARVIEPPTEPGDSCSWSVYRDPSLVPASAYEAVGEEPPRR